jgi:hypothetical protein
VRRSITFPSFTQSVEAAASNRASLAGLEKIAARSAAIVKIQSISARHLNKSGYK